MKTYTSELEFLRDEVEKCHKIIENQIQMLKDAMSARHAKPEQAPVSIPFITQEKLQELMKDEDDDTQGFEPDWANFQEGRAVGWTEAFERIVEKIKEMPWENDTKDSLLIWLKEQK